MRLRCETNTPEVAKAILVAFEDDQGREIGSSQADFEHGQWFVTVIETGQQFAVCDAEKDGVFYFDFEEVSAGDPNFL
jgi:hypothetical protein